MFERFQRRSNRLEHLDIGDYTPEEYEGCIIELQRVNRWLGDTRALENSLIAAVRQNPQTAFSVIDVGAGSGELLRTVAAWANANKRTASLVGIELNRRSAEAIIENSPPEISSVQADVFNLPFADNSFDYAICSLFTHHFADADVVFILRELARVARERIFVIDLHRHPIAYYFYTTIGHLFLRNRLIREDGALSILRSFTPRELFSLAEHAGLNNARVERSFPYRLVLTADADIQSTRASTETALRIAS
jgi:ubiquinone/menaquinone biosynthesis C-methylase UbiE